MKEFKGPLITVYLFPDYLVIDIDHNRISPGMLPSSEILVLEFDEIKSVEYVDNRVTIVLKDGHKMVFSVESGEELVAELRKKINPFHE
mgnify:CR=1 FL=1